jgi:hypothetical protein
MSNISIVGPGEYNDVVVEIDCSPAFTAVVRNEAGKYLLEIFNLDPSQIEEFAQGRMILRNTVELDKFLELIQAAKDKLEYQSNPAPKPSP